MTTDGDGPSSVEGDEEEPAASSPRFRPSPFMAIGFVLACFHALGVFHVVSTRMGVNECDVTYMYESPQYVSVAGVDSNITRYSLFAYGEGERRTDKLRRSSFRGVPVLFVPGNSGSHKQVRSLASVALRKAADGFDFFAVDFEEEISAAYGGVLGDQSAYAAACVRRILDLYDDRRRVVLIGHSIGGVVAKAVFAQPGFDTSSVSAVVTLATPHQPVALLDAATADFYSRIDASWDERRRSGGALENMTLVSIAGGDRDIQVRSGLCRSRHADLNVVSTAIPGAWVSADHRCIVWCKQIVLAVVRSLFDGADLDAFRYQLQRRTAGKTFSRSLHPPTVQFDPSSCWVDASKRQLVFKPDPRCDSTLLMIKTEGRKRLMLDAFGLGDVNNWVFACKATAMDDQKGGGRRRICKTGENLSAMTSTLPYRKSVLIDMERLRTGGGGHTHVVAFVPRSKKARIVVDAFDDREVEAELPSWYSFVEERPVLETSPGASYHEITFVGLDQPWQAYDVKVEAVKCPESHRAIVGVMRFDDGTTRAVNGTTTMVAKGPALQGDRWHLVLHLDPSCESVVTLRPSTLEMWGQMARFYSPAMVSFTVSVVVAVLSYQTRSLDEQGSCGHFLRVLAVHVTPMVFVLPSKILSLVAPTDYGVLADQGVDFAALPLLLFSSATGFVSIIAAAAWFCVLAFGNLLVRFAPAATAGIAASSKFPVILSVVLVGVASASCGTLALCLGTFSQLVRLFAMYCDCLDRIVKNALDLEEPKRPVDTTAVNVHFANALLWAATTVLNAPALVTWARSSSSPQRLLDDPSLVPALILAACLAFTWGDGYPNPKLKHYRQLGRVQHLLSVLIIAYGSACIYRVNYFVCAVFVVSAVHQLVAPSQEMPPPARDRRNPRQTDSEVVGDRLTNGYAPSSSGVGAPSP